MGLHGRQLDIHDLANLGIAFIGAQQREHLPLGGGQLLAGGKARLQKTRVVRGLYAHVREQLFVPACAACLAERFEHRKHRRAIHADRADEAERFRILAAQREGANGVNAINRLMESIVREHVGAEEDSLFYPGRLVIIRKNTPVLDVYNGDVGIVIPQADDATRYDLYIGDRHKRIPVGLLPEHDTAFAMTIHQSQGSQFEHVAVLLPVADDNPLCCRELFYTGVTRAQKEAAVFGTFKSIEASVLHKTERASGLADRLLGL